ncbi:hypothetical protein [Parafilimonas terrae]|jgi:hypothetical protein|uniref:Uncharacterized protein n=1 Tax=Parafilimonas terrae TaxID=1465490 RepID=A0A1I5W9C1_9BACT|nr:hypothetical protein [Parafilimonas terrae]SFQ15846.1 hypothetical protein SAMN05444277_10620 [Parafilimonas terrae]
MIRFFKYKQLILSMAVLVALIVSFAFPADGFARSFLLGLSAGISFIILGMRIGSMRAKKKQYSK